MALLGIFLLCVVSQAIADCTCSPDATISSECAPTLSQDPTCTVVKGVNLTDYSQSAELNWQYLTQVTDTFFLSGAYCGDVLRTLSFPVLQRAGSVEIIYNDLIEEVGFPSLQSVDRQVVIWSNDGLAKIDLPLLKETRYFSLAELASLEEVDLPSLQSVGQIDFLRNEELSSISLPKLRRAFHLSFWGNSADGVTVYVKKSNLKNAEKRSFRNPNVQFKAKAEEEESKEDL